MISGIVMTEFGPTPGLVARERDRLIRETLETVAKNHHRFTDRHFRIEAKRLYNYLPRKGEGLSGKAFYRSYMGRKLREKGHQLPLVWSGQQRTLARIGEVRSRGNKTVLVRGCRGLNRRNPHSLIRMNEEVRRVADSERQEAEALAQKTFAKKLRSVQTTKTTRIS
jgi:hypothetical protein